MLTRRTYQLDGEPNGAPASASPNDLAGYPTVEALVQGYRNSSQEAQRWRDRATQLDQALQAANPPRQEVPSRGYSSPYDRLAEFGLPVDAMRDALREEIRQEFQPIARGLSARSQVLGQYPDYQKYEADVANFVNGDPALAQTYNAMFSADPVGAMEYAFLKFGEQQRRQHPEGRGKAPTQATEQAHAQIPTARSGESRQRDEGGDDTIRQAWEHYQKTGNPTAFAKARLGQVVSKEFYER